MFSWMFLRLTRQSNGTQIVLIRGLCGFEAPTGPYGETRHITSLSNLPEADQSLEAIFVDNTKRVWKDMVDTGTPRSMLLSLPISLGRIKIPTKGNDEP